jgi:hypothetical protein
MPRKPNYRFERAERDRVKAAKKAERLKAKKERANTSDEENAEDTSAVEHDDQGKHPDET